MLMLSITSGIVTLCKSSLLNRTFNVIQNERTGLMLGTSYQYIIRRN
jgi:hypothetical protein